MIKIALYSEDRTLHPLLSSALGKEFQVLLESDQEGMSDLVAAGGCDVMILDLNSNHDSLEERIGFSRRLIASNVPRGYGRRWSSLDRIRACADRGLRLLSQAALDPGSQDDAQPGI